MVRKETSQKSEQNSQARSKEESRCQAVLARPKGSTTQSRLGAKKRATHQGNVQVHLCQHQGETLFNGGDEQQGEVKNQVRVCLKSSRGQAFSPQMQMHTLCLIDLMPQLLGPFFPQCPRGGVHSRVGQGTHDACCALVCSCLQKWLHFLSMSPQLAPHLSP